MKLKKDDIVEIQWLDIIASSAWHKEEQASIILLIVGPWDTF